MCREFSVDMVGNLIVNAGIKMLSLSLSISLSPHAGTFAVNFPAVTLSNTFCLAHKSHATISSKDGSKIKSFLCASMAMSMVL